MNWVCFAVSSVLDFLCHNRMSLLFIDTLMYRLWRFFSRRRTMSPSCLHEWIHLFCLASGSRLFCPRQLQALFVQGGCRALGQPLVLPCSTPGVGSTSVAAAAGAQAPQRALLTVTRANVTTEGSCMHAQNEFALLWVEWHWLPVMAQPGPLPWGDASYRWFQFFS